MAIHQQCLSMEMWGALGTLYLVLLATWVEGTTNMSRAISPTINFMEVSRSLAGCDVKLMPFMEPCPEGYGFPDSEEACKKAVKASGFDFGQWSTEGPYEESHPRCFWSEHDNDKAGYMLDTPCGSSDMTQWSDLGAVCVECGGCFGACTTCKDALDVVAESVILDALVVVAPIVFVCICVGSGVGVWCCIKQRQQEASQQPTISMASQIYGQQTISVQCPASMNPGDAMQVQDPRNGQMLQATVPEGVMPGGSFTMQLPPLAPVTVVGQPVGSPAVEVPTPTTVKVT